MRQKLFASVEGQIFHGRESNPVYSIKIPSSYKEEQAVSTFL